MSPRQNVIDETDNMTRQTIDPKQAIDPRHGWVRYTTLPSMVEERGSYRLRQLGGRVI